MNYPAAPPFRVIRYCKNRADGETIRPASFTRAQGLQFFWGRSRLPDRVSMPTVPWLASPLYRTRPQYEKYCASRGFAFVLTGFLQFGTDLVNLPDIAGGREQAPIRTSGEGRNLGGRSVDQQGTYEIAIDAIHIAFVACPHNRSL